MDDSAYYDQLRIQKEKTRSLKEMQQMPHHDFGQMPPQNNLLSGLGALGNLGAGLGGGISLGGGAVGGLGALGSLGLLGNQVSNLISFLNSRGGDPINSSVFLSNVSSHVLQTLQSTWL